MLMGKIKNNINKRSMTATQISFQNDVEEKWRETGREGGG